MNETMEILMRRDRISKREAEEIVSDCRARIAEGEDPEEVMYDIGLEIDYIFDLI